MDPRSAMCLQRIDEGLANATEIVEALAEHEPELVEPVSAVLSIIHEVHDPAERAYRTWRMDPPMPGYQDAPAFQLVMDTFEALKAEAERYIGCLAVTSYVIARQTGPVHQEEGFTWRRVKSGGLLFNDALFLNAPINDPIDTRSPVIVFGIALSGGPPLPVVIDVEQQIHSLQDEQFWGACAYDSLLGAPPTVLRVKKDGAVVDVPLASVDWTTLDRVWMPGKLPEGARMGPASLR